MASKRLRRWSISIPMKQTMAFSFEHCRCAEVPSLPDSFSCARLPERSQYGHFDLVFAGDVIWCLARTLKCPYSPECQYSNVAADHRWTVLEKES